MKLEVKKIEIFQLFDETNTLIYETKIGEQMMDVVKATQENGKLTLPSYYAVYDQAGDLVEGFEYDLNHVNLEKRFAEYCRYEYAQELLDGYDYAKTFDDLDKIEDDFVLTLLGFEINKVNPELPKL